MKGAYHACHACYAYCNSGILALESTFIVDALPGTPQDILRGVYLCELAASQKHVKAARYVGQLYERGIPGSNGREGLSKDPARAMAWLKYAADPDTSSPPAINEYSPSQQEQQQLQSTSTSTAVCIVLL